MRLSRITIRIDNLGALLPAIHISIGVAFKDLGKILKVVQLSLIIHLVIITLSKNVLLMLF